MKQEKDKKERQRLKNESLKEITSYERKMRGNLEDIKAIDKEH